MQVVINGDPKEITEGITVEALLETLGMNAETTVVEHNGEIIARDQFPDTPLSPGDTIELVKFVGGG